MAGPGRQPCVGRSVEVGLLVDRARAGVATLLTGVAGIGKTRVLAEVARALGDDHDWLVLVRHATPATKPLPLGVLADLLDVAGPPLLSGESLGLAYRAVLEAPGDRPGLLVIDDAPLLDDASATVVQRLIETGAMAVLVACRTGEDLPAGLDALRRAGTLDAVELGALDDTHARDLARETAAGRLDPAEVEDVVARAGGVPLHLLALVDHVGGGRPGTNTSPVHLEDLIRVRLGRPVSDEVDALQVVALGEPLELAIAEELVGPDALVRLEEAGLIALERDRRRRRVRMAHPLFGEAVTAGIGTLRERQTLLRLAAAIEQFGRRRDDRLRSVLWRLAAGDALEPSRVLAAATDAFARGGVTLAERLLGRLDPADSVDAAYLLASLRLEQGRAEEAAAICAAAPGDGDDASLARLAVTWAIITFAYLGDAAQARAILARFRPQVSGPWQAELDGFELAISFYTGAVGEAVGQVDRLLARGDLPERTRVWYMLPGQLALATGGRIAEAISHGERGRELAPRYQHEILDIEAHAWCTWGYAHVLAGAPGPCIPLLQARRAEALQRGDLSSAALLGMTLGFALLYAGAFSEAEPLLVVPDHIGGGWAQAARSWRMFALAWSGQGAEAVKLADVTLVNPSFRVHEAVSYHARAESELSARGGSDTAGRRVALALLDQAAEHAERNEQYAFAAPARARALALAPSDARASALAKAASRFGGVWGQALADTAQGWLAREPDRIERAARSLLQGGAIVPALHLEEVRTALLQRVNPGSARASAAAAEVAQQWATLRQAKSAVPAGGDASVVASTTEALTERERDVARLAASGLGDRAIADQLGVSPRTVHAHLRSAYRKLGVRGRRDLPR